MSSIARNTGSYAGVSTGTPACAAIAAAAASACWVASPPCFEDIFTAHRFDPPGNVRARAWQSLAPTLAIESARDAIAHWGGWSPTSRTS